MTFNNLAAEIVRHVQKYGVKLIELHDGTVQLLGKYGTVKLYKDMATLQPWHIAELCRLIELIQGRPSQTAWATAPRFSSLSVPLVSGFSLAPPLGIFFVCFAQNPVDHLPVTPS
jgi:hypothetical protein